MKVGDKIRIGAIKTGLKEFTDSTYIVEEFRGCLGYFESAGHREANDFSTLSSLFEKGPDSEVVYVDWYGYSYTNPVQSWTEI